ncbi:hypothetical protein E2C01_090887 [Portunus trituberculatus]|uniref:Uncharacterized protein n=1 Tax=Portunus trituberculatus TaxID=210409 RepID=A0A5B7JRD3_PORTR|nr:hypothetical protein [Portunus trituberculatus]
MEVLSSLFAASLSSSYSSISSVSLTAHTKPSTDRTAGDFTGMALSVSVVSRSSSPSLSTLASPYAARLLVRLGDFRTPSYYWCI